MEACGVPGRFPIQSFRSFSRSSPSENIRESSLSYGAVCSLWPEIDKKRPESSNRMFVLGMGFVGRYFAHQLKQQGWEISGTCTGESKKKELEEMGFNSFLFNAKDSELRSLNTFPDFTHLLVSIPPLEGLGDPVLSLHRDLLRRTLDNGNLQWIGYLSSTSVYGDCSGTWVDEDYPVNATSERSKARLDAERGWLDLSHDFDVPLYVFRLGGIYGPGRSALDTIIRQKTLSKSQKMRESTYYTSRVHVADICQALMASMVVQPSRRVYNVVDDDPASRAEVFAFALALIQERWCSQIKEYPSLDWADVAIEKEHKATGKCVSNACLKKELGVSLLHPTYRSGLQSIAETMKNPFQ